MSSRIDDVANGSNMSDTEISTCAPDIWQNETALTMLLEDAIADLWDRGEAATPSSIVSYTIEIGIPDTIATRLGKLLERQLQGAGQ